MRELEMKNIKRKKIRDPGGNNKERQEMCM